MTDDPKRWLEDGGGATDAERDLLRSAEQVEPATGASEAMWAALATRLPPSGGGGPPPDTGPSGGPGGGAGPAALGSSLGAKTLAAAVVAAVIAIGAVATLRSSSTTPVAPLAPHSSVSPLPPAASAPALPIAPLPVISPPAVVAPSANEPDSPTSPPARLSAPRAAQHQVGAPAPVASHTTPAPTTLSAPTAPPAPTAPLDALRDESALVAAARTALRRGDGAAALASLELARTRHPRGALLQEREVLTIEALAQRGDADTASRRATAFLRAFPTSPHAAHVRTFVR